MDYPLEHPAFDGKKLAIRLGLIGNPQLIEGNIRIKPKKGAFTVKDSTGEAITIRFKNNLFDPLPQVEIRSDVLSLSPSFTWREYLIFLLPLAILVYLTGLTGGLLGLLGLYVNPRIVRSGKSKVAGFAICVVLSLSTLGLAYSYEWTNSPQFILNEESNQDIQQYTSGVQIPIQQNNILYAMKIALVDGRIALSEGRYKDAYKIYQKVLAISYEKGNTKGTGIALGVLAGIFDEMDNHAEAVKAGLLMYKLGLAIGDPMEYGVTEVLLGRLMQEHNRDMAMMWRVKAKSSLTNTAYPQDYINLLVDIGEDLNWLDQKNDALDVFKEAWSRASTLGDSPTEKWVKWDAANRFTKALEVAQKCQEAEPALKNILETFSPNERKQSIYSSLLEIQADCYAQEGASNLALSSYQRAYASYDHQRSRSLGDHSRAKLDKNNYGLTNKFINYLLTTDQVYEALALLETNKARTLTDIQQDAGQMEVYEEWTTLERRHAQERVEVHSQNHSARWLPPKTDAHGTAYFKLLEQQERERRALQVNLQMREVAVSNHLTAEELHAIQAKLPLEAAVLSMYVSYSQIGVFVLTKEKLTYIPTTLSWTEYRNTVNQLRVALSNPYNDFHVEPAQHLYQKLLKPLVGKFPRGVKKLIYSPDDWLALIPLAVIHDGNRYLVERYAISRIPSLRYLVPTQHFKPAHLQTGITCVDPDIKGYHLAFAGNTTAALTSLYANKVRHLVGPECSPLQLEKAIAAHETPTFLHIAAHGSFYESDPMKSGVYLSPDDTQDTYGFWDARAMGRLSLEHIKLVTLSSCKTGMKDPRHSRDIFGVIRALLFSGAQRVLAPLWNVQDQATAKLEQEFYKNYQTQGIPMIALQNAQLKLISNQKFQHPYYWAGFVLTEGPA